MKWFDLHKIQLLRDTLVMIVVYAGGGLFVLMIIIGGAIWLSIMRRGDSNDGRTIQTGRNHP